MPAISLPGVGRPPDEWHLLPQYPEEDARKFATAVGPLHDWVMEVGGHIGRLAPKDLEQLGLVAVNTLRAEDRITPTEHQLLSELVRGEAKGGEGPGEPPSPTARLILGVARAESESGGTRPMLKSRSYAADIVGAAVGCAFHPALGFGLAVAASMVSEAAP